MFKKATLLALAGSALLATPAAQAGLKPEPRLCVYDLLGSAGDIYNMAKDYAVAAQRDGVRFALKSYTDERVATQDFQAGQCDAVFATGLRTRPFNPISGAMDAFGVSTVGRNGKIDIEAGYDVVRKAVQTFSLPATARLMVNGQYEVGGIIPFGTAYPFVRDRNIDTVEDLAGKKIATFDYDKTQAILAQKIGAQPVSADITNFAAKFNNGAVDLIAAPAAAYRPLELYRGLGTNGTIHRFPFVVLTYQLILNKNSFPEGFGIKSRQYWLTQNERAVALIRKAERDIPKASWSEVSQKILSDYTVLLRESRIAAAEQGIYDKQGLKILKRIRCSINAADAECTSNSETWN